MTRNRLDEDDSLGLLLDTICNSFGAVVFLSLLVAIMLKNSPTLRKGAFERRRAELELALSRVERKIVEWGEIHCVQREQMRRIDAQVPAVVADIRDLSAAANDVKQRCEQLARTIRDRQQSAEDAQAQLQSLAARLADAKRERAAARIALEAEVSSRSLHARTSRVRGTDKSEIAVHLRYDRLYVWHRYAGDGRRLGLNTDEFVVLENHPNYLETAPRPDAGIPVLDSGMEASIRQRLKQFDSRFHYLGVVVWPDSYDAFQAMKAVMVGAGYEYRLVPATGRIVDRGGQGGTVQ